jgi:diguanylate cyclase (GGDEF)-like protein
LLAEEEMNSDPPETTARPLVLLLNHQGDRMEELQAALTQAGYKVREAGSLSDTHRALAGPRPDVVILNPLILKEGGVELELLEDMQRKDDPVPVILMVEDVVSLERARVSLSLRDFLIKPHTVEECLHRVKLALATRRTLLDLHRRTRELEGQVSVDFKTGLFSERFFKRVLGVEFKRSQRHQTPLSLLLVDVDDFKSVNDSTEYEFGDEVLRQVAATLKRNTRETDYAARFGGDEFVVLLPQTTPAEAVQTAIRIRQRIGSMAVEKGPYRCQVTVSVGMDTFDGRSPSTVEALCRNTNKALQEAKHLGKNQVRLYSGPGDLGPGSMETGTSEGGDLGSRD